MYYLLGPSTRRQSPFLLCGQKFPKFVRTDRAKHDENAEERTRRYAREHTARSHAKTAASSALMAYPMARGYPLTQYAEHVFLFAQSLALVVLMAKERVAR